MKKLGRTEPLETSFPRHRCRLHLRLDRSEPAWRRCPVATIGFQAVRRRSLCCRSLTGLLRSLLLPRVPPAFPVEFFHHSIILVAREGGDSPLNRPMKRYREISLGGTLYAGDGSPGPQWAVVGPDGDRQDPRWPPAGGGIDIDYCAFPTCPGNPRGIASAPALRSCTLLPPPLPPTPSSASLFLASREASIETKRSPLPRILFQEPIPADPLFRVGEQIDTRRELVLAAVPRQRRQVHSCDMYTGALPFGVSRRVPAEFPYLLRLNSFRRNGKQIFAVGDENQRDR